MKRIERLLPVMSIALLAALAALSGCGGGGGDGTPPPPPKTSGTWVWTSGTDTVNHPGVYGTRGASTVPGARESAVSRTDPSGDLWLFGGLGRDSAGASGYLNDFWKFDGTNWIWSGGTSTVNQPGVYGTRGVADALNVPGGRYKAVSWIDGSGNLWLFGGYGRDSANTVGRLNDLWRFDGTNATWVSGASTTDQPGDYGIKSVPSSSNVPGARDTSVSWIDADGNLWLFGGYGRDSANTLGDLNDLWRFDGADWTWVSGADTGNQPGVYGTKGQADPANVPGARDAAATWIDGSGNLWLFGGWGISGHLNDLWKFDPATSQWTWVSGAKTLNQQGTYGTMGVADPDNVPGARAYPVSWIGASGDLWLFGGYGRDSAGALGDLNDLWKFDPATSQWTWVSGANVRNQIGGYGTKRAASSSNSPGSRYGPASWSDGDGTLWLFGGNGYDSASVTPGTLNDLWKFDGANWTWVSGSDTKDQPGVYGERGKTNVPGGRDGAVSWSDGDGNAWLFGGHLFDADSYFNDLWKFDGADWTWVSGPSTTDQPGDYGIKSVPSSSNVPGGRQYAVSWTDASGDLWLFGGYGRDSAGAWGELNDLWKFDPATSMWTWVSGADTVSQWGVYGTKGQADPGNVPGGRDCAASWIDSDGNLWLFGGYGKDAAGLGDSLNDLWKFDGTNWTWVSGSDTRYQLGVYGTKGQADAGNVPGARECAASQTDAGGNLWLFGGYGRDSAGASGMLNDLWKFDGTNWTWVSGSDTIEQPGVYGTKGVASVSNVPRARELAVSWIDSDGNLWFFGGYGPDPSGTWPFHYLNDLWKFDPATSQWTWVSGSDMLDQPGVYGTKGVADALNVPGAREAPVSWSDGDGNFWLFGGMGQASAVGQGDELNDLWRFTPR